MSKAQEMPFLDHLEELRWRLIKSLAAIIVGGMVAYFVFFLPLNPFSFV